MMKEESKEDRIIDLNDLFKRILHGFVRQQLGQNQSVLSVGENRFYQSVFTDSCTQLTSSFKHQIIPFLSENGIQQARLPNGNLAKVSDFCVYRGNYVDASIPVFGRISHDVLEIDGTFIDISGAQFRGSSAPLICWFSSPTELHQSFQGRPLQSFRKLTIKDDSSTRGFGRDQVGSEVQKELENMIAGKELQSCCEWCYGHGKSQCVQCRSVEYCGKKCQRCHWKSSHKQACCS
mmetsp:Transcript_14707/g.26666  ORF Transcript_14707/g.26666 Transcript_14707/m.26666 type:complete len:235 (-) Transcript_14707:19-723(-)